MSTDVSRSETAEADSIRRGLNLVVSHAQGTVVVTVHGDLEGEACDLLDTILAELTQGQGNKAVAVDLAQATAGPSTAVVLTAAACRARQRGTRFIVKEPSRQIVEALASREWGELIEILPRSRQR